MSTTRDPTDVDGGTDNSKCSIFEPHATRVDNPAQVCSWGDRSLSHEISSDWVRDRITIETQPVGMTESMTRLVFIGTKPDVRLRIRLVGD